MKRKFINGLIMALSVGVISNGVIPEVALGDEREIILEENENDIKGYVNLENYVQLTSGNYEKKVLSENEVLYIVTIEASKSDNVYIMELGNNKDKIKIGDKYIPCDFEKVGGYIVPDGSEKVIEKEGVLYIPFSFFEGLFNGKTINSDNKKKLVLPSNLGDYIDEYLESLKGNFEVEREEKKEDKENENVESNKKPQPSRPKPPVNRPSNPVVKPPVEQPVEEPEKPPVAEPEKPTDGNEEKPPVTEPEKPPVEQPVEPPVTEPEKPSEGNEEKPPIAEPEKPIEGNGEKPPITESEKPLEGSEEKLLVIESKE